MKSVSRIFVIAENTAREAVRDKLLYNLLMFAALMILSSIVLAKLQMGFDARIYNDVGLATIALFGALIAIFVGINLVYKEISLKTVYAMLAKPLHRWEFLVGKYLGLVATLFVEVAIMSAFFLSVVWFKSESVSVGMFYAIGLIFLELCLVTAIAIFFSSFTTPYLAAMFTVALWIAGHLLADLRAFGAGDDGQALRALTEFLYWALPNFDRLDIKADAASGNPVELSHVVLQATYAILYATALLILSVLCFRRRDFK